MQRMVNLGGEAFMNLQSWMNVIGVLLFAGAVLVCEIPLWLKLVFWGILSFAVSSGFEMS